MDSITQKNGKRTMNKCRLCKKKQLIEDYTINHLHTVYKCKNCNFVQLLTEPHNALDDGANSESINQDRYRKTSKKDKELNKNSNFPDDIKNLAHVIKQDTKRIEEFVSKIITPTKQYKFIDIGSGYGHIGFNIGNNNPNIDVHLLETSQYRIDVGINTFKPDLSKFNFHHKLLDKCFAKKYFNYFDISFSFHVLEHVYDPIDFIKNIFNITKKGGHIILEVPNEDDDLQKISDNYKKIIKFPAHVSYWNKQTLSTLLEKANINNVDVKFIPIQRYGFFNYIDWIRFNKKEMISSDDYIPRKNPSWIEKKWLATKEKNFTTDSIMMIIKKI